MPVKLSGNYYSTKEAAQLLHRTIGRVCQMVRWGEMNAVQISPKQWLIHEKEINRLLRQRGETELVR